MKENSQNLTIGTFARVAEVNVETIRFYQRKGLLPEPDEALREHSAVRSLGRRTGAVREVRAAAWFQPG